MEIIPGIYQIKTPLKDNPLGYVNTYLIEGTDGWVLIDTGWNDEEAFEAFSHHLKEIGLDFKDINLIIVTHIHPDHFGMAYRLKQLSGADLALHEVEKDIIDLSDMWSGDIMNNMQEWMRSNGVPDDHFNEFDDTFKGTISDVFNTVPDRALKHGEIIHTGHFDLQIIWTPGHSPGHICLYEPTKKLLFSGDHILPMITPNISIHANVDSNPLGDYLQSLKLLEDIDMDLGLPAHEDIFTDLPKRIEQLLAHHEERKREIIEKIQGEAKNAYDISSLITWMEGQITWDELGPIDRRIAVTESLAHLEALRVEEKIERIQEGALTFYKAI
ncbi:MAG: MBL fold metallo-hydrolase [Chloroflexi bacterium]|nr:MBL fold metallo-hydrolase [Chloroflexota bacterium]